MFNKDFGKYWHPATGFAFRSASEVVVIGKWDVESRQLIPLAVADTEECERLRLKYVEKPDHQEIEGVNQVAGDTLDIEEILTNLTQNSDSDGEESKTEVQTKDQEKDDDEQSFSFEDSDEEFEAEIAQ